MNAIRRSTVFLRDHVYIFETRMVGKHHLCFAFCHESVLSEDDDAIELTISSNVIEYLRFMCSHIQCVTGCVTSIHMV